MRVISFDVFDTVLTRTCAEPRDLFLQLGVELSKRGDTADAEVFALARRQAEHESRRGRTDGEVTFDRIYDTLAKQLGWTAKQRVQTQALELSLETEYIRPVPAMRTVVDRARREAGRIVFMSDMYLPSVVIRGWLDHAGFWQELDQLFVSCEEGVSKKSGGLFRLVRDRLGASFNHWEHYGDHPLSDCERPAQLGIHIHPQTAVGLVERERLLRGARPFAPRWRSLLAGAARLARVDKPDGNDGQIATALWCTGANLAGPLFHGFTAWCLEEAERRGLDDLYFLSRGGQLFLRIAREMQQVQPRKLRLHYLPVSRLALAGTADATRPEMLHELAAPPVRFHSARQACANLGLAMDPSLLPGWLPPESWERNLTLPERTRLADFLLGSERLPRVGAALEKRREQAHIFLLQQGLDSASRTGLVDTGWMGTIQRNLEVTLGTTMTGFYLGTNPWQKSACAGPTFAYSTGLSRGPLPRVHAARVLVELLSRADHGPVMSYESSGGSGTMKPVYGTVDADTLPGIHLVQEAVLAFTRRVHDAGLSPTEAGSRDFARIVDEAFLDFHDRPTRSEALTFGRLPHSDQLLETKTDILCPEFGFSELLAAILRRARRPACWWLAGQARLGHPALIHAFMALKEIKWRIQSLSPE